MQEPTTQTTDSSKTVMATSRSEQRRLRELRKYYFPPSPPTTPPGNTPVAEIDISLCSVVPKSPDKILNAFMQLIACKLKAQRAMVSVVESSDQYFLAEATRSLNLENGMQTEDGDCLWMGCGSTPRSVALCANTIALPLTSDSYPLFCVSDLSADPKYCNLPYVVGGPRMRFYAGTPLVTSSGLPIGSVFIIDSRPRAPLSRPQVDFLGVMARNVMEYLEMKRGSDIRVRSERMSEGLAALVHGGSTIAQLRKPEMIESPKIPSCGSGDSATSNQQFTDMPSNASCGTKVPGDITTHERIFSSASKLLRESLQIDYTILLDITTASSVAMDGYQIHTREPGLAKESFECREITNRDSDSAGSRSKIFRSHQTTNGPLGDCYKDASPANGNVTPVRVLGFATTLTSSHSGDTVDPSLGFRSPDYHLLRRLVKRYPDSKLWTFDEDGDGSSSEDDESSPISSASGARTFTKFNECLLLLEAFPGARQIMLAPLWDVDKATHVAACFAVCLKPTPVINIKTDGAFMRAFLNNVSMTCSRATTAAANRLKGDFISNISHELRSPLHGILASTEFLTDSLVDRRQKELCANISTCGQSLLEVITDILEYTKINTMKQRRNSGDRRKSLDTNQVEGASTLQPDSEAQHVIDVIKVCEDAVSIVTAAYVHHQSNPNQENDRSLVQLSSGTTWTPRHLSDPVPVILDISFGDWNFFANSGSLKRIIMNLVGNSLKYTTSSFIKVTISLQQVESNEQHQPDQDVTTVQIVVTDTGRGMSEEFLRTKLFTPFAQESVLSPGTGLGLNIVQSIVQLEGGTINVSSKLGEGTTTIIKLPLGRPILAKASIVPSQVNADFAALSKNHKKAKLKFQGFQSAVSQKVRESLRGYLTFWLDMEEAVDDEDVVMLIVDGEGASEGIKWIKASRCKPRLMVVGNQSKEPQLLQSCTGHGIVCELLITPFGPYRLAKSLLACLEQNSLSTPAPGLKSLNGSTFMNGDRDLPPKLGVTSPLFTGESNPFEIAMPCAKSETVSHQGDANTSLPTEISGPDTSRPRILCVDDNAINLNLLKRHMEKLGFRNISCAQNGAMAFEIVRCQKEPFDLILMDLSMPICDGFQSSSLIRSLEKLMMRVPTQAERRALIVALTGLASQRDQDAAKAAGIDHFLTKPLKFAKLKELMVEWGVLK